VFHSGAKDMIDEYWAARPDHKDNPSSKKKRGRQSSSSKKKDDDKVISAEELQKRRRKEAIAKQTEVKRAVESDSEQEEERPKKKQRTEDSSAKAKKESSVDKSDTKSRKSSTTAYEDPIKEQLTKRFSNKAAKRAMQKEEDNEDEDAGRDQEQEHVADVVVIGDGVPEPGSMDRYKHLESWEDMVQTIQTVEKADDDTLRVFFVMYASLFWVMFLSSLTRGVANSKRPEDGADERVAEDTTICNRKFAQKVCNFSLCFT